jgi:hypothetical protein
VQKAHLQRLREIAINHSLLAYISYEEFA